MSFFDTILSFFSCRFGYRAIKPKIKLTLIENKDGQIHNAFIESPTEPRGIVHFLIENVSPTKAQIKQVCIKHDGKFYCCQNVYNKYSENENFPSFKSKKAKLSKIEENDVESIYRKVPLTIEENSILETCFTFPTFPNIKDQVFNTIVYVFVVGKKNPILKVVSFEKVASYQVPEPFYKDGKKCYAVMQNVYKISEKKTDTDK